MAAKKGRYAEQYTFPTMLKQAAGVSPHQYAQYTKIDGSAVQNDDGIPMFALLRVMNTIIQESKILSVQKTGATDVEGAKVQAAMQHEALMKSRITNQTKLGILILKREAFERNLKFLYSFQGLMKNTIMLTAAEMGGVKRENVILLTKCYNQAVNFLGENVKKLSWEEDGAHYITQSRLDAIQKIDEETDKVIADLNSMNEKEYLTHLDGDLSGEEVSESGNLGVQNE